MMKVLSREKWRIRKLTSGVKRKISKLKRKYHHPLIHHIHKKHRISRKTLFYMKEYGPQSHVAGNIIRESIKILILASLLSSFGGVGLRTVKAELISVLPLLILLPALNDMIGDFGTIVSSKFTTMLYLGKTDEHWWESRDVRKLVKTIFIIALVSSLYIGVLSYAAAYLMGFAFSSALLLKIIEISVFSTMVLTAVIFLIALFFGMRVYKNGEDPNNFLIPISTAVADLGSMLIFTLLVMWMF